MDAPGVGLGPPLRPGVGGYCSGLPNRSRKIAGAEALADAFADHLDETRVHQRLVEERLAAHEGKPSRVQDTAPRVGAGNLGAFFAAQPDTSVKLAGFAFAFEHLEIAGYELLRRVAEGAGDAETAAVAREIVVDERRARIAGTWDAAMDVALDRLAGARVG
jgi:ferritin-like metal-binding protein YciE